MSEIDELRRLAYGRPSGAAEEAAAVAARAELARRERPVEQPAPEAGPNADDRGVELTIVDPDDVDEPGFLRRFASSWRVWAVPAFATFVIGVVVAVASGLVILQASRTGPAQIAIGGDPILVEPGLEPGNLERATALLASPQSSEDIPPMASESIDASTTHLLATPSNLQVFAAMSTDGTICITVYGGEPPGSSYGACSPPTSFVMQGIFVESQASGVSTRVRWNGEKVSETRTLL